MLQYFEEPKSGSPVIATLPFLNIVLPSILAIPAVNTLPTFASSINAFAISPKVSNAAETSPKCLIYSIVYILCRSNF